MEDRERIRMALEEDEDKDTQDNTATSKGGVLLEDIREQTPPPLGGRQAALHRKRIRLALEEAEEKEQAEDKEEEEHNEDAKPPVSEQSVSLAFSGGSQLVQLHSKQAIEAGVGKRQQPRTSS